MQLPPFRYVILGLILTGLSALTQPVCAQVNNWSYKASAVLTDATYDNIINFYDSTNNVPISDMTITVAGNSQVTFGTQGSNFSIYKTTTSGTIIPRTDLANITLRGNDTGARLQFGGNGIIYTKVGYNGGSGASDGWDFASGKNMTTNTDLFFQSGGNGTDGVAGEQAYNGGKGGDGGTSSFNFTQGSATFSGQTQFGGDGGNGGVGANSGEGYYATKGGTGGDGGTSYWTMTAGTVEFKNLVQMGGTGGQGGLGGQNLSTNAYATHGAGGTGGSAKIALAGGTMTFNAQSQLGGAGGYSQRGTGGMGGTGKMEISGGTVNFNKRSVLGGMGGQTEFGTGGAGGIGYVTVSGGTFNAVAAEGFVWGGTGGTATGVGADAGVGGQGIVYFTGGNTNLIGNSNAENIIGGTGGESIYANSGAGGKGIVYFTGGKVDASYLQIGGDGGIAGDKNAASAGAGGDANVQFNGATAIMSEISFGGDGGDALTSKAVAGVGGNALIYFDGGNVTLTNSLFGGTGGSSSNLDNSPLTGTTGGTAQIYQSGGVTNFTGTIFGGTGGDVILPAETESTSVIGGAGGNAAYHFSGGNAVFNGTTVVGGTGGNIYIGDDVIASDLSGSTGGAGGSGALNITGGMITFKGNLYVGGTGGQGNSAGAGGTGTIAVSGGVVRFESGVVLGGLTYNAFDSLTIDSDCRTLNFLDGAAKGTLVISGGSVIIDNNTLITSYNSGSSLQATGGSILFNISTDSNSAQSLGAIVLPSIVITGSAQLGVTMDSWKAGKYNLDSSTPVLVADTSNSLKVDSTSFSSLFYNLEAFRGAGAQANELYLKSVEVKDLDEVWSGAGENAQNLHSLAFDQQGQRDINNTLFQSRNYEQLNQSADQIIGGLYADALTAPLQRVTSINQIVLTQIIQANGVYKSGFVYNDSLSSVRYLGSDQGILANNKVAPWGGYYGGTGSTSYSQQRMGYDYDSNGFIVGLDLPFYTIRLGGFYAFGDGGLNSETTLAGSTKIDSQDHLIGLYMKWNALFLTGYWGLTGNYGYSSYDSMRILPDGAAAASYNSSQWGLYLERGWSLPIWLFTLDPHLAIQYESLSQDGFTEYGSSNLKFGYDSATLKSCRGIAGIRGLMSLGIFEMSLTGSYIREMGDCDPFVRASIVSTGDSMTVYGLGGGRDWFNGGVGLNLTFGQLSLMGNYNIMLSGDTTFHSGMATIRYKF